MKKDFTRVAIIDHETHTLYIEEIPNDILETQYNGEEEDYIKDNYDIGEFSWDYILHGGYIPVEGDGEVYDIVWEDIV